MSNPILACRWAVSYKARRPPRCGCLTCHNKWLIAEVGRLSRAVQQLVKWQQEREEDCWI